MSQFDYTHNESKYSPESMKIVANINKQTRNKNINNITNRNNLKKIFENLSSKINFTAIQDSNTEPPVNDPKSFIKNRLKIITTKKENISENLDTFKQISTLFQMYDEVFKNLNNGVYNNLGLDKIEFETEIMMQIKQIIHILKIYLKEGNTKATMLLRRHIFGKIKRFDIEFKEKIKQEKIEPAKFCGFGVFYSKLKQKQEIFNDGKKYLCYDSKTLEKVQKIYDDLLKKYMLDILDKNYFPDRMHNLTNYRDLTNIQTKEKLDSILNQKFGTPSEKELKFSNSELNSKKKWRLQPYGLN